ncbi:hypothetical protein KM043_011792 [Ampulex compressa]|nr:hypothetical protein KM043_011792 [Ampulex compressa]
MAYTPNIDLLVRESIIFKRAYAQQALCAPSRNSFLTSRRPDTLQLYDFYSYWRNVAGNYTTLPQHLKNNGYITKSIGKVFHPGKSSNGSDDSYYSWTEEPFHPYTNRYKNAPVCQTGSNSKLSQNLVCPVHIWSMPNKTLPDLEILNEAQNFIQKYRNKTKNFFLAVGFEKPHIPLKYPRKYLKYHPLKKFKVPEPYMWPRNVSRVAYNPWTDLREREDIAALKLKFPWEKIPVNFSETIIQSYYASISYIDDLIGVLIRQLHVSKIRDNTVVILTSDHGWSLGEHAEWAKYSNFDVALRVPLIISIPDLTFRTKLKKRNSLVCDSYKHWNICKVNKCVSTSIPASNLSVNAPEKFEQENICRETNALVELVDIFPTIADLTNVPIKLCPAIPKGAKKEYKFYKDDDLDKMPNTCSEGISLMPLIRAVLKCKPLPWKKAAFSQYPRPGLKPTLHPNSDEPRLHEINIMGYTLKTDRYRYTAWIPFSHKSIKPDWKKIIAEELYDHDLDMAETTNRAAFTELSKRKKYLKLLLQSGWRAALPINSTLYL